MKFFCAIAKEVPSECDHASARRDGSVAPLRDAEMAFPFRVPVTLKATSTGHRCRKGESVTTDTMTRIDPVCGMTVDPATAAGRSEHEGTTYLFCSGGCKRKFDAEPGKYANRDGGPAPLQVHHIGMMSAPDAPAPS